MLQASTSSCWKWATSRSDSGEQAAAVEQSRPHAGLNALDERLVLGLDLSSNASRSWIHSSLASGSDEIVQLSTSLARGRAGSRA